MSRAVSTSRDDKPPVNGVRRVPAFDPAPSARFAARALAGAHVAGALIGRLAVWAWLSDWSEHELTKDADFAVTRAGLLALRDWLRQQGLALRELPIGGVNVHDPAAAINVDFIERTRDGDLSPLFADAIEAAAGAGLVADIGGVSLPLVPAEHLAAMKLGTGRPEKDDRDVKRLLRGVPGLDVTRLRDLVARFLGPLGTNRLEEILSEIGHPAAKRRY